MKTIHFRPVRNGIFIGVSSLLGSLCLYCTGVMMDRDGPKGPAPVDEARASPPTFVRLAQGQLTNGQTSQVVQVSGYAELVLYVTGTTGKEERCNFPLIRTQFRMGPDMPFSTSSTAGSFLMQEGGRIRVEGTEMRLYLQPLTSLPCPEASFSYVLAGVK